MEQNQANLQNADDSKNAGPSPGHPQSELSLRRSVSNEIAAGVQVDDVNPDISKEPEPAERPLAPINPTVIFSTFLLLLSCLLGLFSLSLSFLVTSHAGLRAGQFTT